MGLTTATLRTGIEKITAKVEPIGAHLNELDGRLGDGDLGVTMVNGFNNIATISDDLPEDFGMACMECAKAMTKVSGSSFGTLMGISLMAVAKQTKGESDIEWERLPDLLQAALDAMIARGGASIGDKTMLDSLTAVIASTADKSTAEDALIAATTAADSALVEFHDKTCKIGRARIFGDKTKGMDDPGMVAIKSMVDCFS
ncbi:dihydroxyacetone kinase subunit DhaL [Cognatishimia sp. WU-CL00825]|uniref:dihydroxyacetone kinase subunit L n=1 Tax=Cognatishimia sp. WU-CL00825 TaxID=3127658 RepID=UPI003108F83F